MNSHPPLPSVPRVGGSCWLRLGSIASSDQEEEYACRVRCASPADHEVTATIGSRVRSACQPRRTPLLPALLDTALGVGKLVPLEQMRRPSPPCAFGRMDAAGHRNGLGTDGRNRDRLHVLPAGVRHSEQQLAELAASVDASIEIHPPVLRDRSGRYEVVAGAGRVEVARRRGRMEIAARVIPSGPEFDGLAELVQIDENLVRVDPPPAERDKLIRRRKELWERRHPEAVGSGVLSAAGKKSAAKREGTCDAASQVPSFVSETARATGKSKRGVQRSLARTEKAGPEVATAYERSEVSPAQVDELAKLPKDKQEAVLAKIKGKTRDETRQAVREAQGQPHTASPPLPTPPVSSPSGACRPRGGGRSRRLQRAAQLGVAYSG
jgi:ParB-like chromosome segregation protein Spo0J